MDLISDPERLDSRTAEWKSPGIYLRAARGNQIDVYMVLTTLDTRKSASVKALLDSGCTGSAIDEDFVKEMGWNVMKTTHPVPVYNADGTPNSGGAITEYVELEVKIGDHKERLHFAVTKLGKSKVFLGYDWLRLHSPHINWRTGAITFDNCPEK